MTKTDRDALARRLKEKKAALTALEAEIAGIERALGRAGGAARVSPLAPARFPDLPPIAGVRLATGRAGIKYRDRDDLMLAELAEGSALAGAFTRSATCSAPVLWCREKLAAMTGGPGGRIGMVVNAGNANAFTGADGVNSVKAVARAGGSALGVETGRMFTASTGVIGEPLPHDRITAKLAELTANLTAGAFAEAAKAIMTTDTFPKGATAQADPGGVPVAISGIAKGSGMIAPDMATMLVFIFTDCAIAQPLLQSAVSRLTEITFNAITVDGDASTSDTLLVGATGKARMPPIAEASDPRLPVFEAALHRVMHDLALQVVCDGEGATKRIAVAVTGAETDRAARAVGLAIANSPLVKTAVAGEDPNWGRVVMAVGKSGEAADRDRLSIRFGDILVAERGRVSPSYREEDGAAYMKGAELEISVDIGVGRGAAIVWTCDLTKRYIEINADYRS